MIIKARPHNSAGNLARYLLTPKANETEFMLDLRDSASDDLRKALTDWETIGRCKTRGERVLYHAHIRLRVGEKLNEAQWFKVIEDLETSLAFTNCPRAIIGHDNRGTGLHVHVVWSRLDPLTNKLVSLSNDLKHHHAIARAAEREFGLQPVEAAPERQRKKRRLSDREIRALKDRGINEEKLTKIIRAAWRATDSGEEMRAMLGAIGVDIKAGDRRDYVVEYKGLKMNPVRLLDDVNTAAFRERMKDASIPQEREGATVLRGRRAKTVLSQQFNKDIANDQAKPAPKAGFTKKRHKALVPRLRPKLWYGDPGI